MGLKQQVGLSIDDRINRYMRRNNNNNNNNNNHKLEAEQSNIITIDESDNEKNGGWGVTNSSDDSSYSDSDTDGKKNKDVDDGWDDANLVDDDDDLWEMKESPKKQNVKSNSPKKIPQIVNVIVNENQQKKTVGVEQQQSNSSTSKYVDVTPMHNQIKKTNDASNRECEYDGSFRTTTTAAATTTTNGYRNIIIFVK